MEIVINRNLIFAENQYLETERLKLRPVTLSDANDMHEYASDEETVTYVFPIHQSFKDTKESIANYFMAKAAWKIWYRVKSNWQVYRNDRFTCGGSA